MWWSGIIPRLDQNALADETDTRCVPSRPLNSHEPGSFQVTKPPRFGITADAQFGKQALRERDHRLAGKRRPVMYGKKQREGLPGKNRSCCDFGHRNWPFEKPPLVPDSCSSRDAGFNLGFGDTGLGGISAQTIGGTIRYIIRYIIIGTGFALVRHHLRTTATPGLVLTPLGSVPSVTSVVRPIIERRHYPVPHLLTPFIHITIWPSNDLGIGSDVEPAGDSATGCDMIERICSTSASS